ncbi:uncharacterized protein LOC132199165 [Neocloeon triangulifer]|uniref:uncharacterized protein LOC132199165 n=1 Tax=Neocloeon triangulifer TaxID=2078957 RepID=UPI00286F330D|nr:uncharacterized protein LOC132199165 [Neocloeon triangulifer]
MESSRTIAFIEATGVVQGSLTKHKALIKFTCKLNGKEELALLKTEKFAHRGALISQAEDEAAHVLQFVEVGTTVRFFAHPLNSKEDEKDAQWFIMYGWDIKEEKLLDIKYIPGLSNRECTVTEIDASGKRKGTLTYENLNDESIDISFLASKVWSFGARLNPKQSLKTQMPLDNVFYCDAIPQLSTSGDGITWMATHVWRGPRHHSQNNETDYSVSSEIKELIHPIKNIGLNCKALFVQGQGQVLRIINDDFGLALLHIGNNIFESVLFHRAWVSAFGTSMASQKLKDVLQDGDPLRLICTSTSVGNTKSAFRFKWVACSVQLAYEEPQGK